MTPLSNRQKSTLSQLARRAYDHVGSAATEPLPDFGTWRREEVRKACGRYGLTECENRHYNSVAAHFESLIGNDGRALNHLMREQSNPRRQMEAVLLRALESAGLGQSYAEAISRSRFGVNVGDTTDPQFKMLLITVKSRVRAKRHKQPEAVA